MAEFRDHENYNCEITLDDGKIFRIYANWLHNQDLDHWQGWRCNAGSTRLSIDKNLDVWSGECKNDFLGNLKDQWDVMRSPTICRQETCGGCTDDLLTKKFKDEN